MFKAVLKVLIYVAVLICLVVFTPKALAKWLHTPYPMAAVTSGSMWPVLKTGDLVLMRGIAGSEARVGQIIVYKNNKGFTIHRLVRREGNKLITRGDANNVDDSPVTENEVVGRPVYLGSKPFRIPKLGSLAQAISAAR